MQSSQFVLRPNVTLHACKDGVRFCDGNMGHIHTLILQGVNEGVEIGRRRTVVAT